MLSIAFSDRKIIDTRNAADQQPIVVEFPILVVVLIHDLSWFSRSVRLSQGAVAVPSLIRMACLGAQRGIDLDAGNTLAGLEWLQASTAEYSVKSFAKDADNTISAHIGVCG